MHTFELRDAYVAGILDYCHAKRIADREQLARDLSAEEHQAIYEREMAHREQQRVDRGELPSPAQIFTLPKAS